MDPLRPRLPPRGPVVDVDIDELVLDGVGPEQVPTIEEHLRVELVRRMTDGGPSAGPRSDTLGAAPGGDVFEVVAARVAEVIHHRLEGVAR